MTHHLFPHRFALLATILLAWLARDATACAIPVFRFALERWPSDLYEVDVFHRGQLTPEQRAVLSTIEDRSSVNGGLANLEVVRCQVDGKLAPDLATVWESLGDEPLPFVVLRAPGGRRGSPQVWSGPLAEFQPSWAESPARRELVNGLLAGNSVVWLVLPGTDPEAARQITTRLQSLLPKLAEEIVIPQGVGLPGSELASRIPLQVKFTVLTADPVTEAVLRRQAAAHVRDPVSDAETLVVPVFGRGRALQTLRAAELEDDAVAEISRFLCGACSCQVKEQNPGFDLLLSVNWDERLFSPGEPAPSESPSTNAPPTEPEYVAIPAGGNASDEGTNTSGSTSTPAVSQPATDSRGWLTTLVAVAAALVVGCVAAVRKTN